MNWTRVQRWWRRRRCAQGKHKLTDISGTRTDQTGALLSAENVGICDWCGVVQKIDPNFPSGWQSVRGTRVTTATDQFQRFRPSDFKGPST